MIGSSENRISYNGNGIATEFAYTFKILEKSNLKVLHVAADGTEELLTTDYYVDMEKSVVLYPGYAPGAEIPEQNRPPILPKGERLVLYREVPITQESALDKHWPFNVIENGLDKLTIICQQIWDRLQRSFYVSESTSTNFDPKVPIEAGKTFRVKDDGTGFEVTEDPGKVIDGATALLKQTTEQAEFANEAATNAQNAANLAEVQANSVKKYKALWFDSVAAMRAESSLTTGAYVNTAGYYEPNDGGGASYLIREKQETDAADGGSLHELINGLVAEMIIENGTVCPEQFGAKGDGISDDTKPFETLEALGNVCLTLNNTYKVNNITLKNKKIIFRNVSFSNTVHFDNCIILGGSVNGIRQISLLNNNTIVGPSFEFDIDDLANWGIEVKGNDNYIGNCRFGDNYYQCIRIAGNNNKVENCCFLGNTNLNINHSDIKIYKAYDNVPKGNIVVGNHFSTILRGDNIDLFYGGKDTIIDNNIFYNVGMCIECKTYDSSFGGTSDGVTDLETETNGLMISNNVFCGFILVCAYTGEPDTKTTYPKNVTIINNKFVPTLAGDEPISFIQCGTNDLIIDGNEFILNNTNQHAVIMIYACKSIYLKNNTIKGKGRFVYTSSTLQSSVDLFLENNLFFGSTVSTAFDTHPSIKVKSKNNVYNCDGTLPMFSINDNLWLGGDILSVNGANAVYCNKDISQIVANNCKFKVVGTSQFSGNSVTISKLIANGYSENTVRSYGVTVTDSQIDCTIVNDI